MLEARLSLKNLAKGATGHQIGCQIYSGAGAKSRFLAFSHVSAVETRREIYFRSGLLYPWELAGIFFIILIYFTTF